MRVAINGFGRIGRIIFRIAFDRGVDIAAINDIHGPENAAYLLKYDTVYGMYGKQISVEGKYLVVDGTKIPVLSQKEPSKLPWKKHKIDLVIESTGVFRERKQILKHKKAGAKYMIVTAPIKGKQKPDITVIKGVNHKKLNKKHKIISVASCTTNCLVPIVKILHDKYKIKWAMMTTIHAYTNDQALQDSPHNKIRRGRAASQNIIPTSTGASESVAMVIPNLIGKIKGIAIRVPIITGSLIDLTAELNKNFTVRQINKDFKNLSEGELNGVLGYSEDPLVSSDIIRDTRSAVIDSLSTEKDGNLLRVLAWYDNEYGYSSRVVDTIKRLENLQ
jgi:glyceraldehyde-3-phosphate dehydrogenase type I